MEGAGTNEDLLFRFTERMDRDEIARMREIYAERNPGHSLDAELGVYGEGWFGEVSGDDRLRMERALLGQPRNDRERLEVAAFALEQQRREASGFGAWLADGTLADEAMSSTESELQLLAGGPFTVGRRGEIEGRLGNFDGDNNYTGPDIEHFRATTGVAVDIAQTYASRIDAFADIATTGIAILGAIAAAVITVVTGGAAAPLIAAALITGLASMSANYAIKGGRYGWEQAAVDLGMTAVQAITAGVGAQLGAAAQVASKTASAANAASRTLTSLSRIFTGNPVVDQIIVGMISGSISGLGTAALDERTWEHGADDAVGWLLGGLARGALAGGATAAATNSIEALARNGAAIAERARAIATSGGLLRRAAGGALGVVGRAGEGLNTVLNSATGGGVVSSVATAGRRGLARGAIQAVGGMAGRGTELAVDRSTGRFRGDMGDALIEMGHAGLHSFVQGIGEGAGEAVGQGMHNRRLAAAAQRVNEARGEMGLPRIDGDPLAHDSPLRAAAEDLMFMEQHGRFGSDSLGRALSLEHVAQHGGMAATVVTRFPDAIVETGMRAALLRHVDPALQADFAHVPIRVLSESEFRTVTRSHSGDAVTMIENGHPVVVVREGASVARLADEGPHLVQSSDPATRERVARLDEATLPRWDELDLDTQIGLYRDKVDLEIDAHERIRGSLERELADAATSGDRNRLASVAEDMALNDGTLANLRSRADDVAGLTPARREAMGTGREARPDFLDQPARLFSKRARGGSADEQVVNDILETMLTEIGEKRRMAARGGLVDDAYHDLPDAVRSFLRRGERMPGRSEVPHEVKAWARREARARFGRQLQEALLNPGAHNRMTQAAMEFLSDAQLRFVERHGRLPEGVEFHHLMAVADFPEFAHLAEVGTAMPTAMHREVGHGMDPTRPLEAATLIDPDALSRPIGLHNDPEGNKFNRARQSEIAEGSRSTRDVDRDLVIDFQQRVRQAERALARAETRATRRSTPEAHEKVRDARSALGAAQQHLAEVQARVAQHEQMRSALMRHLSPELQTEFADVPIRVLSDAEFTRLTRSQSGDAVTLIVDGQPVVVVREGTPPARVADEGPHLAQLRDPATAARAARLDEATLRQWDQLDLDTQIDLFRTKTELEIDAHQRIEASLRAHSPLDAAELARNSLTLHNLRQLQEQVRGLGPTERAAILADGRLRPPYLDQPARLFSKRARGERPDGVERVFEPFVGPELASPAELARRYAGAEVVAAEASHPPDAAAIQAFEALGGRFVPSRFGEGLPDASVDRVHARFPLPHEKAQEMSISVGDRPMHEVLADIQRRQTEIESLTNLAPHALRLLRAGGEIEVVFHEASILRELAAAQKLTWTDGNGVVWRLEAVGPASTVLRAQAAPHSGFGVPDGPTAHAMTLRKVRVPPSPEERAHLAAGRGERKREERAARAAAHAERTQRRAEQERVAEARVQALREREAHIGRETETRLRDLREGRTTVDEDLRQRLAPVAASTRLRVDQLIEVILRMDATFGTSGRRIDAQEIIDSLRNRVRDGRPPRYGDLDGLVDELAVELNALAIGQMREHLLARRPDAVLGVERGGALLAEVLSRGVAGFPETAVVAKSVQPREGQPDLVQRTPLLEAEIRRRLETLGQSHFAIVDFYMGGIFAGELRSMIAAIVRDHPDATFEVVWLRETQGFERVVVRPTLQDLAQGVALTGRVVFRNGRLVIENPSPMVTLPPLAGTDPALPQLRAHDVPVDVVLGDDMPSVLTPSSTAPIRIFDRQGRVVRVIPVGTPDPVTGEPLRSTRDILLRLMQGGFTIEPDEHD
ncbi:hypothetical protein [Hydrogenophaga sp.]|uniref:hypothetical protein n=1 Tax=Hydrogenophaga sp. TaxID=1904254 RepID=UPI00356557E8